VDDAAERTLNQDIFGRIDALTAVGLRLAGTARTGRVLLARIGDAIDPEWIPQPWGQQIVAAVESAARSAREPMEARSVERILARAWGAPPLDQLDDLDLHPVAVTPGAQVHRGRHGRTPVAIKVLRPGLASSVRQDLALLGGLLAPLAAAFPAADASALLREFRERVLDELDLEHEATVQRRVYRALRTHPFLTVPAPVMPLCGPEVLVTEWVDGVPLTRAPDPDQAAARLVVFVFGAARSGIVHADPDPRDVLLRDDGRLAILDFGANAKPDPRRIALTADALEAFVAEDTAAFAQALDTLGILPAANAPAALELGHHAFGELATPGPARLDSVAVLAARDRLIDRRDALAEVLAAARLAPEDLWPARSFSQLFGTIARVGATADWTGLALGALRQGWG
jgi:hypothetical protein